MNYDDQRIDDAVLALLAAFSSDDGRAWKGFDFEVMSRLPERGYIENPVNKNKSVLLSRAGLDRGQLLANELFRKAPGAAS